MLAGGEADFEENPLEYEVRRRRAKPADHFASESFNGGDRRMSHELVGNGPRVATMTSWGARGRRCNHRPAGGDEMNIAANQGAHRRGNRERRWAFRPSHTSQKCPSLCDPRRRRGYRGMETTSGSAARA